MEFPTTNLQSELISAGLNPNNPSNTYSDFTEQLIKNGQQQREMEQTIAKAKLMTQQAQIQTQQQQEAQAAGINPSMANYVPKAEALVLIKKILETKGEAVSDDDITEFSNVLPDMVNRQDIDVFASRFMTERSKAATSFVASAKDAETKEDSDGDPLVAGQTYSTLYDNKGNASYIRAGQERPDGSLKATAKLSSDSQKSWNQFIKQMNPYTASSRNSIGVAMQSYIRAVRALEALNQKTVTSQVAANVVAEIGAIYKGGSPDQTTMEMTYYPSLQASINDKIQALTGKQRKGIPDGLKQYIIEQVTRLNDMTKKVIENNIKLAESGNKNIITPYQEQWDSFKETLFNQLDNPTQDIAPDVDKIPNSPISPVPTSNSSGKTVPSYTVKD